MDFTELNRFIAMSPTPTPETLNKMQAFIDVHEKILKSNKIDPSNSRSDDTQQLLLMMKSSVAQGEVGISCVIMCVRIMKILTRKELNRVQVRRNVAVAMTEALRYGVLVKEESILLDTCTYFQNIFHCTMSCLHAGDVVPVLLQILSSSFSDNVKSISLAALQNVSLQRIGQEAILVNGGMESLIALLFHGSDMVCRRCVATIHNTVSSIEGCKSLRENGGIPLIVSLLSLNDDAQMLSSAAGTLQNLCREKESVQLLIECNATPQLCGLLSHPSSSVQVCVVGALLNICSCCAPQNKVVLKKVLAAHLASSALVEALK
eukprot:PhF_6_TR41568/c0_g1_i1/m.62978